ncbi:hypothetical protein [Bifidobacterium sp. UTBIF-78]|uniref:hypothetical protein n=1 Tax=Bifidobacterium sp. UTBIF-78 TaxID=1465263 RepID=UPI00112BFF2B|nr:hypothetical protein [Bifidobacterium sp. UTBIF-78]TPF95131.1 hypothetical protein BG22_03715 [Bifidobacterium sp. UTBIF-78]
MVNQTDGTAERKWISGIPETPGNSIAATLPAIIGCTIMTAIMNAVFLLIYYLILNKRSLADVFFHGDPPFPIDATVIVLGLVILPPIIGILVPMSDRSHDYSKPLAIRARRFGRLKACPDRHNLDGDTKSMDIRRILFHFSDTGTIRVYAENDNGPVFLTLRLNAGRMRIEDEQPVDAALLHEAEHEGSDVMDSFLDPRCSYSIGNRTYGRATGRLNKTRCLIVRQENPA